MHLIDTDVHQTLRSYKELLPYLPRVWHERITVGGFGQPATGYFSEVGIMRNDAVPEDGSPAGSDRDFLIHQLVDAYQIDVAILTGAGILGVSVLTDADYAAAVASAYNDWLIAKWLSYDRRFRGAMVIATQDPQLAAAEIDRVGDHTGIVEVVMASATRIPYGQRFYHPIYAAAERHGLPVAIHPGTEGAGIANPPTAAGYPSRYIEWHTCLSQNFMAHLVSLVCEGVFVKFPNLRFVLIEGGVSWLAPLMWRLDKNYKALRAEVPWLTRLPSEYIKEHCRLTTQPIEEPPNPEHLVQIFEMIDAEHILMYSSDYPHWDFDSPLAALQYLPERMKRRIMVDNARELYRL